MIKELKDNTSLNEAEVKYLSQKYKEELKEETAHIQENENDHPEDEYAHHEKDEKKIVHRSSKYIIQLYYPELAFVIFKVKDARNWYTLKLGGFAAKNVRSGIRSINLYDRQHAHDGFSSLLVNIEVLK